MKGWITNEKGALLPFTLLLLTVVCTTAVFGTGIFVSKQKTALFLTDYYETKVMELMALQAVFPLLENQEPVSGSYYTNHGEVVYAAAPNPEEVTVVIHLRTVKADTRFASKVIYNMADREIIQWVE